MTQRSKLPVREQIADMGRSFGLDLSVAIILISAYMLRTWLLEIKPPHFDEGINGHFVVKMWKDGYYHYDPTNFHGPLYFYFLQFSEMVFGRGIFAFRFITALISIGCVVLAAKHRRFFGASAVWAALLLAIGTAFVFYGRYAIHESLFIFCQMLFSYGFFLHRENGSRQGVAFMATGLFGSFALKETFFIFFGTWAIALLCLRITDRIFKLKAKDPEPVPELTDEELERQEASKATATDWFAIFALGALAAVILFTGFFLNQQGFEDMFEAFKVWTKTGTGNSGHEKPFPYWLKLLVRYEWPILFALAVTPLLYFTVGPRRRLMVLVGFGTWLAYSIIPYKTPWLVLNIVWPLAFVFGFAMEKLSLWMRAERFVFSKFPVRMLVYLAVGLPILMGVKTTLRLNFVDFTNEKEPYVYVQSTMQLKRMMDAVTERVEKFPEDRNMKVFAFVRDPWPLPWLFSLYPNLNYGKPEEANMAGAGVILIDGVQRETLEKHLEGRFYRLPFQIRDSYDQGYAYLDFEKFRGIVPSDSEIFSKSRVEGEGQ